MKSAILNYLRFLLIGCNAMQVWQSAMYFIVIFKKSIQESLLYFFSCKDFTHELIWHFVVIMLGLEICRQDLRTFLQGFINGCCDRDEAEAKLKHSESEISMFKEGFSQQILGPNKINPK